MKFLYFDCFSGISGDMTIGALLDLGVDQNYLTEELKKIHIDGYELQIKTVDKNGISACSFQVLTDESVSEPDHEHPNHEHGSEHPHGHVHSHSHNHDRSFEDINKIIDLSAISENAKQIAKRIFNHVAKAESKIHGKPLEEVHFHEVGGVDSIIDIVGTAICIDYLKPDNIFSSVINDGSGFAYCQHGQIPVPVPAVLEIFKNARIPFKQIDIQNELVTPTGAAIIAGLSERFMPMPEMQIVKVGCGAGKRNNKIPNLLRAVMGEVRPEESNVSVIETNIDDCTPEILGYTMEKLFDAGALDVFFTNIHMKKNRPACMLSVICRVGEEHKFEDIIFSETTTIGLRKRIEKRTVLPRKEDVVTTKYGQLKIKKADIGGMEKKYVEYEDAKEIAKAAGIPLRDIYREVL